MMLRKLKALTVLVGAQVMAALWLTYWEGDEFQQPLGFYVSILHGYDRD